MISNIDLRNELSDLGVKHFEIAKRMNITDAAFSKKIRTELSEEKKKEIIELAKKIKVERRYKND